MSETKRDDKFPLDQQPDDVSTKDLDSGQHTPDVIIDSLGLASRQSPYTPYKGPITDVVYHYLRVRRRKTSDLDEIATQPSVYDTDRAEFYQPKPDWENISAFDPSFRWTWCEEQIAIRKLDFRILLWVLVMCFSMNVIRGNLPNATADNFLSALGLTTLDFNAGNTAYRITFLLVELPSQLISKAIGPDIWIPIQIVAYSVIGAAQFALQNRAGFLATRVLLAIFQGGFIPDVTLYISYWYNSHEMPIRMAFFYIMNAIAMLFANFSSVGLLEMSGILGYDGWRWMFLVHGLITLLIGLASFFLMPPAPTKTKSRWFPNGYLTDREVKIIVNRTIRDDPGKSGMHNREAIGFKHFWEATTNWYLWPMYFISLCFFIPAIPLTAYLQISFRQFGFSRAMANLLTVPYTITSMISAVTITIISEAVGNRAFICSIQNWWYIPPLIALVAVRDLDGWAFFGVATVFLSFPLVHAIQVGWTSANSGTVASRTVSAA